MKIASDMNPYAPMPVRIAELSVESAARDTRLFKVEFLKEEDRVRFRHEPGQFAQLSVLGYGEAPISITSSPTQPYIEFCIKRMGEVTQALHNLGEGDAFGIRGPYGNTFPRAMMEGKNIVFVAGGIGLAPLRSLINFMLHPTNRASFANITIIYGARSPGDLLFKSELAEWAKRVDVRYHETVDAAPPDSNYQGKIGFVPTLLDEVAPSSENAVAITCGPPIMIKYVLPGLDKLGFAPENIVTTLEMRMKCGIGKCGRCNIGRHYVCIDGPVFTLAELKNMPAEF
ncbi:MAG: FAD/NAD(P)-binding protein [Candidatus Sumerlaeota bacterium]|nr:FAD/NAD(P)-binding protein [Candidatus Sumerlaeota bacterium]